MAYFSADELQNRLGGPDFSATSTPTTTNVTDMSVELSAMWDGLVHQTEGDETPLEYVKQACMAAAVYQVGQMRKGEPIDPLIQIQIMREFMRSPTDQLFFDQPYPKITGEW
jgi:hypothetical protein